MKDTTGAGAGGTSGRPTQLLERNIERIKGTNLLVLGAPRDPKITSLFRHLRGVLQSFDYAAHLLNTQLAPLDGAGLTPVFAAACKKPDPAHDVVVAYLQKGKDANDCMLAMAGSVVSPGGRVFLVGENSAGIRSNAERLEERVGPIEFTDSARHCVLYEARAADTRAAVDLASWEKRFHVPNRTGGIEVVSLPGVFSHGRLDEGTGFLLPHIPTDISGAVLDFGCGSGVLGATIKALNPACEVSLVDSNAFALLSTERTFAANGLAAREIRAVDGLDAVGDQRFNLIVTNPPFHQGIGTDYNVVTRFLESCEQHLHNDGVVLLVANRFLPYERMMPKSLPLSLVAEDAKYKVLKGRLRKATR